MDPFAKKMIQGSFAFLAAMLLMLAALSVFYFHTHPRCSDELLSERASPDGRWIAAVLLRRCGEESPFFVHANLRAKGSGISFGFFSGRVEAGEVFIAEQDSPESIPQIKWLSSNELHIQCPTCRSPHKEERWRAVTVR
jgi:hypothetical protein